MFDSEFDLINIDSYRMAPSEAQEQARELFHTLKTENKTDKEIWAAIDGFCKTERQKSVARKLQSHNELNKRFKDRTFDNFVTNTASQKNAKAKALKYCQEIKSKFENCTNLAIVGNGKVGVGKTHIASAVTTQLNIQGIPAKFINSCELFANLKKDFNLEPYKNIDVLVIDDLGKEKLSEWVLEQLYALFNARYEKMLPTIITCESNLDYLRDYYNSLIFNRGNAIISRFREYFNLITLDGTDYREHRG